MIYKKQWLTNCNLIDKRSGDMEQNNIEMMYKKLKKDMIINRVISSIILAVSIAVLVLTILEFVEVKNFLAEAEPVMEELSKIDMEALNESLEHFNFVMETLNLEGIKETFDSINFDGLNELLEGLDVNELTETLDNINEGANRLDEIGEWFENSPLNIFGIGSE